MLHFARPIAMVCANNNSEIRLIYIESSENRMADYLSRWNLGSKYRKCFSDMMSSDTKYQECEVCDSLFDDAYDI